MMEGRDNQLSRSRLATRSAIATREHAASSLLGFVKGDQSLIPRRIRARRWRSDFIQRQPLVTRADHSARHCCRVNLHWGETSTPVSENDAKEKNEKHKTYDLCANHQLFWCERDVVVGAFVTRLRASDRLPPSGASVELTRHIAAERSWERTVVEDGGRMTYEVEVDSKRALGPCCYSGRGIRDWGGSPLTKPRILLDAGPGADSRIRARALRE